MFCFVFVSFCFVSFRFVSFRFVLFSFVLFSFVLFCVLFCFFWRGGGGLKSGGELKKRGS